MKESRPVLIATTIAHASAWLIFIWLVFPTCIYGGVARESASMIIAGCPLHYDLWDAAWYFTPVVFTGIALALVLTVKLSRLTGTLLLSVITLAVTTICALGYLGFGIGYIPSALAMLAVVLIKACRADPPKTI
ncbi:MAG: hypothetical protein OXR67_01805 [Chloroflexota bacterium]|nr:hypothetical protein [Chloroflexota bacterium]MDE2937643.1 hypothetical protein [Chloroflexota bacterium]